MFDRPEDEPATRRKLGSGYESERLPLRSWWVMEDFEVGPVDILRYVFTRRPWGHIGSTDTILLRRTDEEVEATRDAAVPSAMASALGVERAREDLGAAARPGRGPHGHARRFTQRRSLPVSSGAD